MDHQANIIKWSAEIEQFKQLLRNRQLGNQLRKAYTEKLLTRQRLIEQTRILIENSK